MTQVEDSKVNDHVNANRIYDGNCPFCGAPLTEGAEVCEYCGRRIKKKAASAEDSAEKENKARKEVRTREENKTGKETDTRKGNDASKENKAENDGTASQPIDAERLSWPVRKKDSAAILAILFGAFGAHDFYLGKIRQGVICVIYFLFWFYLSGTSYGIFIRVISAWILCFITVIRGIVQGIYYLKQSTSSFEEKHHVRCS